MLEKMRAAQGTTSIGRPLFKSCQGAQFELENAHSGGPAQFAQPAQILQSPYSWRVRFQGHCPLASQCVPVPGIRGARYARNGRLWTGACPGAQVPRAPNTHTLWRCGTKEQYLKRDGPCGTTRRPGGKHTGGLSLISQREMNRFALPVYRQRAAPLSGSPREWPLFKARIDAFFLFSLVIRSLSASYTGL